MSEDHINYSGSSHPEDQWVVIRTSQQLMRFLGYPDEVECPFAEIFDYEKWHGRSCRITDDTFELGYEEHPRFGIPNHKDRKFYIDKIIDSWLCEDYGIEVNNTHANKHKFTSHNEASDPNYLFMSIVYRLKKYVPLVKRATA